MLGRWDYGKFKAIIDLYNTQKPLPVGYKRSTPDEWCAATVTAAGMQAGLSRHYLGRVFLLSHDRAVQG